MLRKKIRRRPETASLIKFKDFVQCRAEKEKIINVNTTSIRILFNKIGKRLLSLKNFWHYINLMREVNFQHLLLIVRPNTIFIGHLGTEISAKIKIVTGTQTRKVN